MPLVSYKEVMIDSMPFPVCRPKRGKRCAFPGASWGYGTQGQVYGYKLHAWRRATPSRWVSPTGTIVQYLLRPANLHDTTIGYELNRRWPDFGGPKIIGDKGYCSLGFVFPPKTNAKYDTGWREDRQPKLRKRIETVFSQLVETQIRSVQTKTLASLRFRAVVAVLAHNLAQP